MQEDGLRTPLLLDDVESCADLIIERVGRDIRLALPLGLGKPVELVNALYARAKREPGLRLTILTALILEKPARAPGLEGAFLAPVLERVFAGVPELEFARDLSAGRLPDNVRVLEFFFRPGSRLNHPAAQRDYISTNYTFAARDVFAQGCNVCAQMIARRETALGMRYSLSCNPDTGPELVALMRAAAARGERRIAVVGVVNQNLPYMTNDAEVAPGMFDAIVEHPRYTTALFSTPKTPVASADYAIGLHASSLVRDGGTLQIGIGALGDAITYALQMRQSDNRRYRESLAALGADAKYVESVGGMAPFAQGLYGASEMFVDGFLHLLRAGILRRRVYDFWALQQVVDEGLCIPARLEPTVFEALEELGVRVLRTRDFEILQHHGLFSDATRYEQGYIVAPDGERAIANLADPQSRAQMARCLGPSLRRGIVMHGAFFLGPRDFYEALRSLPAEERDSICMTGVDKVNQLDLNPRLYQAQRRHARFLNTAMMVTLSGNVVSDGLEDGRVVSGVGGQYNFVAQAHQLRGGRSILMVRAVRETDAGAPTSNVIFNYGHTTIPRHLRDIVITEYGIADLRARTDAEVAKALINIADSRFQPALLERARKAGKIENDYAIPEAFRHNFPQTLEQKLPPGRGAGLFPAFPFGSDFTDEELNLAKLLKRVKARAASTPKWRLLLKSLHRSPPSETAVPVLRRLGVESPTNLRDRIARRLLLEELDQ